MKLNLILSHLSGSWWIGTYFGRTDSFFKPTLDVSTPPFLNKNAEIPSGWWFIPPKPLKHGEICLYPPPSCNKNGGRLDFQCNTWNLNSTFLSFCEVLLPAVRQDIGELGSPSDGTNDLMIPVSMSALDLRLEKIWLILSMVQKSCDHHLGCFSNRVNHERSCLPTGERRISEPSTVVLS